MPGTAEEQSLSASELAAIREQLKSMTAHDLLRTSKRSVAFLRYIVQETLDGHDGDLKERTIGVNVFGKALTYDTNLDHAVRTAASELRRRLALYYSQEEHRDELRILLLPGSYVPQFRAPGHDFPAHAEPAHPEDEIAQELAAVQPWWRAHPTILAVTALLIIASGLIGYRLTHRELSTQQQFWKPLLDTSGPVLIGVGDVPGGPPVLDTADGTVIAISPSKPGPPTVPFADAVTIARVSAILAQFNKDFVIRRENSSSFADLRERPVVLIGAFNNEWSLQLTRNLRFGLAMDSTRQLIYIRDRQHPESRDWAWNVGPHPEESDRNSATVLHDYALISRILDSETGHDVVVLGGLYAYGTQAAGEFLASRDMAALPPATLLDKSHKHLQIVLDTVVTDGTPGPPHIVAVNIE
jgi:hypothetical protein